MLVVTLVVIALALTILLWGVTVFLQGWMYQSLADRLPLRAAIAGLGLSIFITFWMFLNTRADYENKYGTFFNYQSVAVREVPEFLAVRYYRIPPAGNQNEVTTKFVRDQAGEYKDSNGNLFRLVSSDFMTTAIVASDKNKAEMRFEAQWQTPTPAEQPQRKYHVDKLLKDKSGSFVMGEKPWVVNTPSSGALFGVMLLHLFLFVFWFLAFWPTLRYTLMHSVGLAFIFGMLSYVGIWLLLDMKKPKPAVAEIQPRISLAVPLASTLPATMRWTC